jgi:hypothetical protein
VTSEGGVRLATYPAFSGDDVDGLVDFLAPKLGEGDGANVLGARFALLQYPDYLFFAKPAVLDS